MKRLFNKAKNDQWEESEVAMSVIARFGTGGGNTPIVIEEQAVGMDQHNILVTGGGGDDSAVWKN